MFADKITDSMKRTMDETARRRKLQMEYNEAHSITPEGIKKEIVDILSSIYEKDYYTVDPKGSRKRVSTPRSCRGW